MSVLRKRLKYVATLNDDVLPETTDPDREIRYVDISNVDSTGSIHDGETMRFENAPSRARRLVRKGDVIVSTVRTYLRAIAPVGDPDPALVVSTGFAVIRPGQQLHARYSSYALQDSAFVDQVVANSEGVSYPAINPSKLSCIGVPVPPISLQAAIADYLDTETVRIDTLIDRKQRFIALLLEKRTALITHAVTKGLDPTVEMKDSGVEWIGEVPAHWTATRIKNVAKLCSGHTPDKKIATYWENGTIPWVSLADSAFIRSHRYIEETSCCTTAEGIANSSAVVLPSRSVILSRDATVGLCAITTTELAVSQHFMAWVCGGAISDEYLLHVLDAMKQELERLSMGSTIPTIGLPHIKNLSTPLPPLDEQRAIVTFLDSETRMVDGLVEKTRRSIDLLREYRTALISAAVTGQIDTPGTEAAEDVA